MRSLIHSLTKSKSQGVPLPDRFSVLAANGIRFRRGQVHMIAGQPGSGKSLLALDYVVHAGVSSLYFSADSDDSTVVGRVGAMLMDMPVEEVEEMMDSGASVLVEDELAELDSVRFVFDPNPTLDVIDEELMAWQEVYGCYPDVLVFDNLINIVCETTDNEWQGLRQLMAALHQVARQTGSAVLVLHHTSEGEGKPDQPQARKALMGKVAQLPEVILTVAISQPDEEYRLTAVKNRSGKADPSANTWVPLYVDLAKMKLSEHKPSSYARSYWDQVQ